LDENMFPYIVYIYKSPLFLFYLPGDFSTLTFCIIPTFLVTAKMLRYFTF
jgi:hypothetical protein